MTIPEYKEAAVKLKEFVLWSRQNYTQTPKMFGKKIALFSQQMPFYPDRLTRAFKTMMKK